MKLYQYDDIRKLNQAVGSFNRNGIPVAKVEILAVADKLQYFVLTDSKADYLPKPKVESKTEEAMKKTLKVKKETKEEPKKIKDLPKIIEEKKYLVEKKEKFDFECENRLIKNHEKYRLGYRNRDNLKELKEELYDVANYAFFELLKIEELEKKMSKWTTEAGAKK